MLADALLPFFLFFLPLKFADSFFSCELLCHASHPASQPEVV